MIQHKIIFKSVSNFLFLLKLFIKIVFYEIIAKLVKITRTISKQQSSAGPNAIRVWYKITRKSYRSMGWRQRSKSNRPVDFGNAQRPRFLYQRRSKFIKITKQEVTEFERRYQFVVVVVYKFRDRHSVKDVFGKSKGKR